MNTSLRHSVSSLEDGQNVSSRPLAIHSSTPFEPSRRALDAAYRPTAWTLMQKMKQRPAYDPISRPDGLIDLSGAVNTLMKDWVEHYMGSLPQPTPSEALTYGPLYGSKELRQAAAGFFNTFFNPTDPVTASDILAANGVTSSIDIVAWTLCDPGDAILAFTPGFYMLDLDLSLRAGIATVPVSTTSIPDPFSVEALPQLLRALDEATDGAARRRGVHCRALFLCNPANPQGRCYARGTLAALATWCIHRGMHLVSDEIYALSTFTPTRKDDTPTIHGNIVGSSDATTNMSDSPFCSVMSLTPKHSSAQNIHCLYSLSKDLGMGGLRMGFIVSKNSSVLSAAASATWFTWVNRFSDSFSTSLLNRLDLLQDYVVNYRKRLTAAYLRAVDALEENGIPFAHADSGLFIFLDLSEWIQYIVAQQELPARESPEIQLCEWLANRGVFLNPGEFAGCDIPGYFRLVFTGDTDATTLGIKRIRVALDEIPWRVAITP